MTDFNIETYPRVNETEMLDFQKELMAYVANYLKIVDLSRRNMKVDQWKKEVVNGLHSLEAKAVEVEYKASLRAF